MSSPHLLSLRLASQTELASILKDYVGRANPLYFAERLTEHYGTADIYLKREDLNHTGAHKINNAVGQALLAKKMGKKRIIAETGAGQHGVATATVCARFGLECIIYMGAADMERQKLNVFRMRLLGATVTPVRAGTATLKDATSEAIRDWVTNVETTHYILGSVAGPHPYPMMVRDFHACIGRETRAQAMEKWGRGNPTSSSRAWGGSNAMGLFHEFVDDEDVKLIGVEAAGEGMGPGQKHAATLTLGKPGVLHGSFVPHPGRRGADHRAALHQRGSRLPRHRPRALVPQGLRQSRVPRGDGRRGAGRVRARLAHGRDHPRAGDVARLRVPREAHAHAQAGPEGGAQLLRQRGQGRQHRRRRAQHLGRGGHLSVRIDEHCTRLIF